MLPVVGLVEMAPTGRRGRWAILLFLMGGSVANGLVIALIAVLDSVAPLPASGLSLPATITWMQLACIGIHLVPFSIGGRGNRLESDGRQILRLFGTS
jgi:hypothetical protein